MVTGIADLVQARQMMGRMVESHRLEMLFQHLVEMRGHQAAAETEEAAVVAAVDITPVAVMAGLMAETVKELQGQEDLDKARQLVHSKTQMEFSALVAALAVVDIVEQLGQGLTVMDQMEAADAAEKAVWGATEEPGPRVYV